MDRNYFLSYSHRIAILLLFSAIGKLNTKFIPVTISNTELQHCIGVNNPLQSQRTAVSANQLFKGNVLLIENLILQQQYKGGVYNYILKNNYPAITGKDFLSSLLKDLNPMRIWYKLTSQDSAYNKYSLTVFERVKRFYINSSKLIDGFKFVIKIPDKMAHNFVK